MKQFVTSLNNIHTYTLTKISIIYHRGATYW